MGKNEDWSFKTGGNGCISALAMRDRNACASGVVNNDRI